MPEFNLPRFIALCRAARWSQRRLARELGVHQGSIGPLFSLARQPGKPMIARFKGIEARIRAEALEALGVSDEQGK